MADYLHRVKSLADELAQAGSPLVTEELIVQILRGLGTEYREISAAIRARDTTISYEDLYDKLMDQDAFLQHEEAKKPTAPIMEAMAQRTKPPNMNYQRQNRHNQWRNNDRSDRTTN